MKRLHVRKLYKIVIGVILCISILLFAAPRIGRWYIVKHSHELIGRRLEIKKIRVNYFTGTMSVHEIKLFESDSKTIFLSLNLFRVNLDYFPLFRNEIFVKNISLDDPFVEILQDGDKYNFSDLTKSDTSVVTKDTIPSKPTKYIINNIKISRGYVKYTDVALNHTIALNKVDLLIPGFTWNSDSTNLNVDFRFVDGGGLYSNLEINQADSTYAVNVKLDSLNLNIIEPYVKSNMHISSLHGYLSNDIKINGNMRSVMQLTLKGINHVFDFNMTDTLNRNILSFKKLDIDINNLQPDKNIVSLNSIDLTDPYILFEIIDSTNNWLALMKRSSSAPTDSVKPAVDTIGTAGSGSFSFSKLQISGGKVGLSDKTLKYPFDYSIENINLVSTPMAGTSDKLSFNMTAALNGSGTLAIKAVFNPSKFNDLDFGFTVGQFRMKDIDAYFKHYFGFPVTGGIMNFKTENKIRPEFLLSDNSLYFRKFTLARSLGTKVEYHIPLRLALGIMSDKDGIIDLKAPIESKGKEVKVRNLGKIILKIIGNLFIKAAVSPFNLLSSSYNVDPATLQEIRLGLLEPSPDVKNLKSVDIISDILNKKPGVNIDFYYCADHNKAVDSLAYMMTLNDYLKNNQITGSDLKSVADSILIKYILNKTSSQTIAGDQGLKNLCRNYIGSDKIESRLDSIKALQISFISNYLSNDKAIPADRFKIIPAAPDTIRPSGNYPAFRTYFTEGGEKQ
jgi:hypothetical protein